MKHDKDISIPTESLVASVKIRSLGVRLGKFQPRTRTKVSAIVVHTTGCGPIRRWKRDRGTRHERATPFKTGLRIYADLMVCGPHYLVGQQGECVQLCPEGLAAWHVGRGRRWKYFTPGKWQPSSRFRWWFERWAPYGIKSPRELAGGELWAGKSVNDNSIGIEVVPPVSDPRGPWSDRCWTTLHDLFEDLCKRHDIPMKPTHIVTHSDAHPIARTTKSRSGRPWDPGPAQWSGPEVIGSWRS